MPQAFQSWSGHPFTWLFYVLAPFLASSLSILGPLVRTAFMAV